MKMKEEIASRLATIKKRLQTLDLHTLTLRVEEVEKLIEEYTSNLWTSPCICTPDEKTGETLCCNHCGRPTARTSKGLPGDDEMKDWAEIHAIHCYHDGLTSKKHFVEGYLYAVDFFKNNYASPILASRDAKIRELEEANKLAEIKIAELIELNLTPPKN